jgi:hypothetical protein
MFLVSVSAPRAGSSWYYHMTNGLLLAAGKQDALALREKYPFLFPMATNNMNIGTLYGSKLLRLTLLSQIFGSFAVKSHAKPTRFLRILSRYGFAKSSFIYRDPRDRLVSILKIAEKQRAAGMRGISFSEISSFEDALRDVSSSYQHFQMWQQNPETLLVRYEDLVQQTPAIMRQTVDFLGLSLSDEVIASVIERYSKPEQNSQTHFVRGQIGYYKEALSHEQIQTANTVLKNDLLKLGYALD